MFWKEIPQPNNSIKKPYIIRERGRSELCFEDDKVDFAILLLLENFKSESFNPFLGNFFPENGWKANYQHVKLS